MCRSGGIGVEGVFGADGFGFAVGDQGGVASGVGFFVERRAVGTAVPGQEFRGVAAQVGDGTDAQAAKDRFGTFADPRDFANGQGGEEIRAFSGIVVRPSGLS